MERRPPGNPAGGMNGGRRLPAARLAALLALALWAGDARAQSTAQVGNVGQTESAASGLDSLDVAQKFTTGPNVGGYTLTGVDLRLAALTGQATDSAAPRVTVVRGAPAGAGSVVVATLAARTPAVSDGTSATYSFAAPANTPLRPSTDHWVVVEAATRGGGDVQVSATASDAEDGTPAAGWSVGDGALTRSRLSTGAFDAQTHSFMIRVNGSTRTNTPATGKPAVSGPAALGRRLEADRGSVADRDGVPAAFAYQWVRVDGTVESDIPDATSRAYRLEEADVGKTVKARLSFTDDAGNMESRTSDAFPAAGTVRPPPPHGLAGRALVGNLGQAGAGSDVFAAYDMAQKFTTGANGAGYALTGVLLRLTAAGFDRAPPAARVVAGAPAGSDSVAVATLAARTSPVPGSATSNIAYAAPPDTVLDPSTDYWVVVEGGGAGADYLSFQLTLSDSEDSGSAAGWSVDDAGSRRAAGSAGGFARRSHGASYMIGIFGTARTARTRPAPPRVAGPPTAADASVRIRAGAAYAFRAGDFNFAGAPGRGLASVRIETLPAPDRGALTLGGNAVAAGQEVARGAIDAGDLRFVPPAGAAREGAASFTFKVSDGSGDPGTHCRHRASRPFPPLVMPGLDPGTHAAYRRARRAVGRRGGAGGWPDQVRPWVPGSSPGMTGWGVAGESVEQRGEGAGAGRHGGRRGGTCGAPTGDPRRRARAPERSPCFHASPPRHAPPARSPPLVMPGLDPGTHAASRRAQRPVGRVAAVGGRIIPGLDPGTGHGCPDQVRA